MTYTSDARDWATVSTAFREHLDALGITTVDLVQASRLAPGTVAWERRVRPAVPPGTQATRQETWHDRDPVGRGRIRAVLSGEP